VAGGTLLLNALVMALHASGAADVRLALILPRRPRLFTIQTAGNWTLSGFLDREYEYDSRSMDAVPLLVRVQPIPPPNLALVCGPIAGHAADSPMRCAGPAAPAPEPNRVEGDCLVELDTDEQRTVVACGLASGPHRGKGRLPEKKLRFGGSRLGGL
jgi:hypothetical protein